MRNLLITILFCTIVILVSWKVLVGYYIFKGEKTTVAYSAKFVDGYGYQFSAELEGKTYIAFLDSDPTLKVGKSKHFTDVPAVYLKVKYSQKFLVANGLEIVKYSVPQSYSELGGPSEFDWIDP